MRAALLLLLLTSGCVQPTAPTLPDPFVPISASTVASGSQIAPTYDPIALGQVPELLGVTTEVSGGMWILRAQLRSRNPDPWYSATQAGGWSLQLLLNTDQQPTGYAHAYDWVVMNTRDSEMDSPEIRMDPDWDTIVGLAGLNLSMPDRLTLSVPLSVIQDDGALNWRLTTFATVPGGPDEAEGGVAQIWAEDCFGVTSVPVAAIPTQGPARRLR